MAHDSLGAHARDELGLSEVHTARPIQAAFASAGTFTIGAALPLLAVLLAPSSFIMPAVGGSSLVFLAMLGCLAAYAGGAKIITSVARVTIWGALAMALTTAIGRMFGAVV
jgi:VIT1/CCC1 family predicted Fe2+/Mn2+ transporter